MKKIDNVETNADEFPKVEETFTPLSNEELKILKASQSELDRSTLPPYDTSDMAKAKKYIKKNKFSVIFVVITVVLLVAMLSVLGFALFNAIRSMPSKDDYQVTLGDEEFVLSYKKSNQNDIFYFDIRLIADYADLTVSGGDGRLKITCPDGTYVRFEHGSDTATVNGTRVYLDGKAKITEKTKDSEGTCMVPFSFIQDLFSYPAVDNAPGIRIKFSQKDNTIIIRRVTYKESGEALPISFSEKCFDNAEGTTMNANQKKYPETPFICIKQTILVNKNNPLGDAYVPEGLFSLNDIGCPTAQNRELQLESNAAHSLLAMMNDMHKEISDDERIVVTSAYRSYEYQVKIFEKYTADLMKQGLTVEQAEAELVKTSARPGESEHQTGLCVDLIEQHKINLDVTFEDTQAFAWLTNNAHRYGFILRYPSDKTEITGYDYEPWHYRFVGVDAATVIHQDSLCLEEYLAKN